MYKTTYFREIFAPNTSSSWSFGYRNIFDQAFGRYPQRSADLCPYRDNTAEIGGHIAQETSPDAKQQQSLAHHNARLQRAPIRAPCGYQSRGSAE